MINMLSQSDVMAAIIRLVLELEQRTNRDNHEFFDLQVSNDISTIKTYLGELESQ